MGYLMRSELPVVLVAKLLHSFFESIIVANVVKYFVKSVHLGEYRCPRLVKLLYQCVCVTLAFCQHCRLINGSVRQHSTPAHCSRIINQTLCLYNTMEGWKRNGRWIGIRGIPTMERVQR